MINTAIDVFKNTMLYTFYNYPVTYNYCFTNGHTPSKRMNLVFDSKIHAFPGSRKAALT